MTAVHVLLVVALLEVAINRLAVPMLRPRGVPPWWHTGLDYLGLFLFYFAGTLAALLLAARGWAALVARTPAAARTARSFAAQVLIAITTMCAAVPLVIDPPAALTLTLEAAFALSAIAIAIAAAGRDRDLGIQLGLPALAAPLLFHAADMIGAILVWHDAIDGPGPSVAQVGVVTLCLAAMVTPYCFAPRPFARSVTRPLPVVCAMVVAGAGALVARTSYPLLVTATGLAIGVELTPQPDPRLAMYLLSIATLAWTIAACAIAPSPARRKVGIGLALIVLGGYGFQWPHHYLLPLFGLVLLGEAARRVRDEELAAQPFVSQTPPITDAAWSAYMAMVSDGVKRVLDQVHSLTTRDEAGLVSTVLVGQMSGSAALPVRMRIERIEGAVLALDVVIGREIDEARGSTFTLWSIPSRALGGNPAGPPASPACKTGDPPFDERFKLRGSRADTLFDDGLRARAVATIDGWIAYWEPHSLRYRVYPGRGAPLDHPMPLSDLALGRSSVSADRLVAVIQLLVELAARGVVADPSSDAAEPTELS